MASIAQCVLVTRFYAFFVLLLCVCSYGVDHMVSFGSLFHFSCSVVDSVLSFLCHPRETWQGCWIRSPGVTI